MQFSPPCQRGSDLDEVSTSPNAETPTPAFFTMSDAPGPARIAVIGAGWWSQGWHIPQLVRNPDAELAAVMQRSEQPRAAAFLHLTLDTKTQLVEKYGLPKIYSSCEELLADEEAMAKIDGVIICTARELLLLLLVQSLLLLAVVVVLLPVPLLALAPVWWWCWWW